MKAKEAAEKIIKLEGLTFAMACLPPQKELAAAREMLCDAIAAAIRAEAEACAKIAYARRDQWSSAGGFGGHSAAARIIGDEISARHKDK